jgi:hypothetical protein
MPVGSWLPTGIACRYSRRRWTGRGAAQRATEVQNYAYDPKQQRCATRLARKTTAHGTRTALAVAVRGRERQENGFPLFALN